MRFLPVFLASLSLALGGFVEENGNDRNAEFKSVIADGEVSVKFEVGSNNGFEFEIDFEQESSAAEFEIESEARFVKLFQCVPTAGICLSEPNPPVKEIFFSDLSFVKTVEQNEDQFNVTFFAAAVAGKPQVTIQATLSKLANANGAEVTIIVVDFPFDLDPANAAAKYLGVKAIIESSQECEPEDDDSIDNVRGGPDSLVCASNGTGFDGTFTWAQKASLFNGTEVNVNIATIVSADDDDDEDAEGLENQQVILYSFQIDKPDFINWDPSFFVTRSYGVRDVPSFVSFVLLAVLLVFQL